MTEEMHFLRVGELYWKKEGDIGWNLGKLIDLDETIASFQWVDEENGIPLSNDIEKIALKDAIIAPANPLHVTYSDMTSLRHMNEPALVKNLYDRWIQENRMPYTRISNILIAVNPLRYLEKVDKEPFVTQSLDKSPPHPYHIAENAYRQMRSVKKNQSIVISGESGSGKTETSKIILDYLTDRSSFNNNEDGMVGYSNQDEISQVSQFSRIANNQEDERAHEHALGDRLMETIPILESFGNAKTHRNHNSSRFGKYMRLQFSKTQNGNDLHLTGASIDTYLLETSRLVQTPTGERNFHVFYELLRSGDEKHLKELNLVPNPYATPDKNEQDASIEDWIAQYNYLNRSGCDSSHVINDKKNYQKLLDALDYMNIDSDELFRVVAGLLHLGNLEFLEEDTSEGIAATVNQEDPAKVGALEIAAELLGLDPDFLMDAILKKKISRMANDFSTAEKIGGRPGLKREASVYFVKKDLRQASYSRDTIAKSIYDQVFGSLMRQCADALEFNVTQKDELPYIGVLDIFGFEDFEPNNRNSLEQLMINYANETLQNMFNQCILKNEYELYQLENIFAPQNAALRFPIFRPDETDKHANDLTLKSKRLVVHYEDNKECISLLADRANGLFSVIDMVGKLAGPSDRKLNDHFHKLFKLHPCFIAPHPKDMKTTFIVKHFAGTVRYCVTSFLDKNNNIASPQFDDLIQSSNLRILNTSLHPKQEELPNRRRAGGSVSQIFSQQMKGLATELESTRSNFIRCIKPNTGMNPGEFDRGSVVHQLRCSGTVQACQVLQVGLPTRVSYVELIDTYIHLLGIDFMVNFHEDGRLFARALCYVLEFPTDDYRLGDTKLFFKTGKIHLLDTVLNVTPTLDAEELETRLLKYITKRRWITAVTKVVVLRYIEKVFHKVQLQRRALILQCWFRQVLACKQVKAMRTRQRISNTWGRFCSKLWVQQAFDGRTDEKLLFLQMLLMQKESSPKQKWFLTWLGPLQRSMYVKKLGKSACISYLSKRAFISLLENVREKRACVKLQSQFRRVLATKQFHSMKIEQRAKENWNLVRNWVKGRFCFMELYRRSHLKCLEIENFKMLNEIKELNLKCKQFEELLLISNKNDEINKKNKKKLENEIEIKENQLKITNEEKNQFHLRCQLTQQLLDVETTKLNDFQDMINQLLNNEKQLKAKINEQETCIVNFQCQERTQESKLEEKSICISDLKEKNQILVMKLSNAQEEIALKDEKMAVLESSIATVNETNSKLSNRIHELENAIATFEIKHESLEKMTSLKISELMSQLEASQQAVVAANIVIESSKEEIAALTTRGLNQEEEIVVLKEEGMALSRELIEAQEAAIRSGKIIKLECEINELKLEIKEYQKEDKNLKDKIFFLQNEKKINKKNKPENINMEIIELTTKLAQRESQIINLEKNLNEIKLKYNENKNKIIHSEKLEIILNEREHKIDTLKLLLKQTQIKKEKLLHEIKTLKIFYENENNLNKIQINQKYIDKIQKYEEIIQKYELNLISIENKNKIKSEDQNNPSTIENQSISRSIENQSIPKKNSLFETKTTASLAVVLTAVVVREFIKSRII